MRLRTETNIEAVDAMPAEFTVRDAWMRSGQGYGRTCVVLQDMRKAGLLQVVRERSGQVPMVYRRCDVRAHPHAYQD